ncbi:MAG: phosphopyruvate hydratase [Acidobacteriaceae bacterium]
MAKIEKIKARQILDSRGNPTVEADVILTDGSVGRVGVPSGMSTGKYEAFELRDNDPKVYGGQSVLKAVRHVEEIIFPAVKGRDAVEQRTIDETMIELDGTENKSKLGANAILAVSLAVAAAEAKSEKLELFVYLSNLSPKREKLFLPYGMFNIVNGGAHVINGSDFQEYMVVPKLSDKFSERLRAASEIFHALKKIISDKGLPTTVGDEGGFAPPVESNTDALDLIVSAIEKAGYKAGENVFIALDMASSHFYKDGKYFLKKDNKELDNASLTEYCKQMVHRYPIISIEDPLDEDDFADWTEFTKQLGSKIQIVGDDLYTTNAKRLKTGIEAKASNAILIKPNQIGTLSETIDTISLAYQNGFKAVLSHRSGETADTFIADLAVAMRVDQVKFGSVSRSERLSKYDRLLEIEEIINP